MADETPKSQTPTKSPSELVESAKVQVSGAATDVINAVKSYGKPDGESGVGHYVGKAEDYLHQLHSPSDQPAHESVVAPEKQAEPVVVAAEGQGAEKKAEPVVIAAEGQGVAPEKKAEPVVVAAEGHGVAPEKKAESVAAAEGGQKKSESTGDGGGVGSLINKAKGLFK